MSRVEDLETADEYTAIETEHDFTAHANEAFKRTYGNWFGVGLIIAVSLHFAFFALFPSLQAADLSSDAELIEAVELPPEVEIPPPPEMISRPATPKVAAAAVDEDVTIAPTTFESNPVENLPPPPATATPDPSKTPAFIPYDVPPKLLNTAEVMELLQKRYPQELREAGVEGKVVLWIYIDQEGQVMNTVVQVPSGYESMDRVAQGVADAMKFKPAQNRDKKTPVWVAQAIAFEIRR